MLLRIIMGLAGAVFAGVVLISMATDLSTYFATPPEPTAEHEFHLEPKEVHFASDGPFGRFDKKQVQRGFQVYKEVCSACHSLHLVSFRDLAQLGYQEPEIKKIAADWLIEVPTINQETGEPTTRKAIPSDRFPSPYPNELAARAANNNALPPDLSLIAKAREGGAPYIYSLLTGYHEPSPELLKKFPSAAPAPGLYHNPYFPNLNLAMPPPITSDGQVTYAEGNPAPTVDQMAKDVAAFLIWTAEPKLDQRKNAGLPVVIFLMIATILGYLAYREIWRSAKRKVRVTGPLDPENHAKSLAAKDEAGIAG